MKINKKIKTIILNRLSVTLVILLFTRMGTFLPIPGINPSDLEFYIQSHSVTKSLVSTFSGNNTFVIGLFSLNIFPFINASILIQLFSGFSSSLAKIQKEGDLEGKRYINRLTRSATLIFAILQSFSIAIYLKQILFHWDYQLAFEIILWLTTGSMIILWLSELITDYGLGNGTSVLIYTNIISNLPNLMKSIFFETNSNFNFFSELVILGLIVLSFYGIVFLQEGVRIIPLISSKQLTQFSSQESLDTSNYLPLRLNQAGVMPIILSTTILIVPNYLSKLGIFPNFAISEYFNILKFSYWIFYFALILLFSGFYSMVVLNPKDVSDQLQKMAVSIPGIRPGIQTTFYLKQVMKRVTLLGGIILATVVITPNFMASIFNITNFNGLSTSSLLIMAGVILDLGREIKNIYYSNIYQ